MTPLERLHDALRSATPPQALASTVEALASEGVSSADIYDLLERLLLNLRARGNGAEADAELVLDIMDAVTGWCHPSAQLLRGAETAADQEMSAAPSKYGARVFPLANGKALVKQTVKRGPKSNDEYVIDGHRERHIDLSDDAAVAAAIREALAGQLPA